MYLSLLSPGERDADHPARGSLFPAFADAAPAPVQTPADHTLAEEGAPF